MTVAQLIAFLQTQPQDIQVVYRCYSEQCLLETEYIEVKHLPQYRADGWVHNARPGMTLQPYLCFPGN